MEKKKLFAAGLAAALLLPGCRPNTESAENKALKEQVAALEQQVAELKQDSQAAENAGGASGDALPSPDAALQDAAVSQGQAGTAAPGQAADAPADSSLTTTLTMEELTNLVDAYTAKAEAALADGTDAENMEQFFSLKQEEKQIDDALDLHEDELEYLYHNDALDRDSYRELNRELERLEDRLDDAEDRLEYLFGIDD